MRYYERAFPVAAGTEALPLRELLAAQHYELADWRDAAERINYRRFFDVADLVALRQEDPDVFEATHRAILQLVAEGSVTGLRIDHVDGLADPAGYLARLRAEAPDLYIVVEKILAADEELPDDWPVAGTTGYEVLDAIGSVLVDPGGAGELEELLARVAGVETPFHEIARAAKREIIAASFRGDLRAVARTLEEPTDGDVAAIAAITAELDVYRTYGGNGHPLSEADRARVERAIERARVSDPDSVLDRVGNVLLEGSSDTVAALAAALGARRGEGRRGHGDLPLPRARLARRGGRRSRGRAADGVGPPPPPARPGARLAGRPDPALDA